MNKTFAGVALAGTMMLQTLGSTAVAQDVIKIGELNSYKSQPAFLGPYRNGMELAVEQINQAGGFTASSCS